MNTRAEHETVFSRPIEVEKIPATGSHEKITADRGECARLAELLSLEAIEDLTAELTITPWRKQGFKIAGTFRANVRQICVVTLEPFNSVVEDSLERYYFRGNMPGPGGHVLTIDPLDDEDIEPFEGNTIDAGDLIREALTLSLDPYPRKPGARFIGMATDDSQDAKDNPFAALKNVTRPH